MRQNPWTYIVLAAVGFGGGFPLSKALLDSGVSVWQFFAPRYVIAAVIIVVFVTRRGLGDRTSRNRGATLGIVNVAFPSVLMTFSTDLLPASVAGILVAFIPVATIGAAHWLVPGERFLAARMPGLVLALGGVVLLVTASTSSDGSRLSVLGVGLGLIGVLGAGVGGALNRRFAMAMPAIELAASQFLAAAVVLVIIAVPFGGLELGGFDSRQWAGLVTMAVVSTAVPFYMLIKAAEIASAATVSNIGYLVPVIAAVGSVIALGDPITVAFVVGSSLILVGIWISDRLAGRKLSQPAPI